MNYWNNKEERAEKAQKHTDEMARLYADDIERCRVQTIGYGSPCRQPDLSKCEGRITEYVIDNKDSVASILSNADGKTAVLNFASYKNPGGMFLDGSSAQEESLCHESWLYNVLAGCGWYYDWNRKNLNRSLYKDRALYSPDVVFVRGGKQAKCSVITCAAPNKKAAQKYCNVLGSVNTKALESRIAFILSIASEQQIDTLILGAFGCGVFGQDADEVAKVFKSYFESGNYSIKKAVFSVPEGRDGNYAAFKKALE